MLKRSVRPKCRTERAGMPWGGACCRVMRFVIFGLGGLRDHWVIRGSSGAADNAEAAPEPFPVSLGDFRIFLYICRNLIELRPMNAFVRSLVLASFAMAAAGCVDPDYDFSKLDTTVTVLKGVDFPVPSAQILLKDVFPLEDYEFITCDANGDYQIDMKLDPIDLQVLFPESDIDRIPLESEPVQYSFAAVPDFLSGKDQTVVVDLSGMQVGLDVQSDIPARFAITTAIESIHSGTVSKQYTIDDLDVNFGLNHYVFLKEKSAGDPDYYKAVPGLEDLLSPIPDAIRFSTKELYADAEQRALVTRNQVYNLTCQPSAKSPIKFAEGTRFLLSVPLNASLDLKEIGLKKAVLNLVIENTTPLDFSFNLYAYDASGKFLDSIRVTPDFQSIPAGVQTKGAVTLTTSGDLRFSSLSLELTASAPASSAHYGTCLNRNQGLKFTGMSLYLPDGIDIKMDAASKNQ